MFSLIQILTLILEVRAEAGVAPRLTRGSPVIFRSGTHQVNRVPMASEESS